MIDQDSGTERFDRTEMLVGESGIEYLRKARVQIYGLGGVGSYAVEAIARAGVGHITLIDFDTVKASNINRQLVALESTLGMAKVEVAAARIHDINPDAIVLIEKQFLEPDNIAELLPKDHAYIIDAIDTVASKVHLLAGAHARSHGIVSCMGAANKLSPEGICVNDISETSHCPLARVIRRRLRKHGVPSGIPCVYSQENRDITQATDTEVPQREKRVQGSISYVPGIVGLTAAGVIVNQILDASKQD